MLYSTRIKLSRITNLSDARYAAAAGFDFISFCFDEQQERFISPAQAKEMMGWISGPQIVAEFANEPVANINEICAMLEIDMVQLSAQDYEMVKDALQPGCIITDGLPEQGGDLIEITSWPNPETLRQCCHNYRVIVDIPSDMSIAEIQQLITDCQPYAISLTAGDEERVGLRDFSSVNDLLEALSL
jgi:phosphoribosylanthranilate isomerase